MLVYCQSNFDRLHAKKDSIHNICSSCARRNDSWHLTLRSYSTWSIDKHLNYSKRAHSMKENVSSKHTLHYSLASQFPNISTFLSLPSAFSVSCAAIIADSAPTYKPYRFLSCDDWLVLLLSKLYRWQQVVFIVNKRLDMFGINCGIGQASRILNAPI